MTNLYAAACRPVSREKKTTLEVWREPLALGPAQAAWWVNDCD
jgi:hypothetical protein